MSQPMYKGQPVNAKTLNDILELHEVLTRQNRKQDDITSELREEKRWRKYAEGRVKLYQDVLFDLGLKLPEEASDEPDDLLDD